MSVIVALPGNEVLAHQLARALPGSVGNSLVRHFPDGESYVRLETPVAGEDLIVVCTLDRPDSKLLPLFYLADAARAQGARRIGLVSPYLAYMRQDKQFHPGEAVTSRSFAKLIATYFDWLVTVDPHLHRLHALSEIYAIPTTVVHAAPLISRWIKEAVARPLLIGPDSESEQWVSAVAKAAGAPWVVLEKSRHGDRDVDIQIPNLEQWKAHQPVLVDDIISTARTMIETVGHLKQMGLESPVGIGVHAVFADNAYADLQAAGRAATAVAGPLEDFGARIERLRLEAVMQANVVDPITVGGVRIVPTGGKLDHRLLVGRVAVHLVGAHEDERRFGAVTAGRLEKVQGPDGVHLEVFERTFSRQVV